MENTHGLKSQLTGVYVGLFIILLWGLLLAVNLQYEVAFGHPLTYLLILAQTHLFTGLFITAHDAMHGSVAPKRPWLNHTIGRLAAFLFVFNNYSQLRPAHYAHHRHVATENDPDFHRGHPGFWRWYFDFLRTYIRWPQLLLAAIAFNLASLALPQVNLILYWVIPSLLSTLQLFYFGTFVPHRGEHDAHNVHKARSLPKNHIWAFLTCYFFGYHYEHHHSPATPWWRLWRMKD